jgi:hypothetical protein
MKISFLITIHSTIWLQPWYISGYRVNHRIWYSTSLMLKSLIEGIEIGKLKNRLQNLLEVKDFIYNLITTSHVKKTMWQFYLRFKCNHVSFKGIDTCVVLKWKELSCFSHKVWPNDKDYDLSSVSLESKSFCNKNQSSLKSSLKSEFSFIKILKIKPFC